VAEAMTATEQGHLPITCEGDLVTARKTARDVATRLGFGLTDVTRIVTAVSELARNIITHAGSGVMRWTSVEKGYQLGIELVFEDQGQGIPDTAAAMEEGFSTGRGLGMGLSGSKRLMDEMEVRSVVGEGTTVMVRKYRRR
jgi:serine/threonine-protein kinase RsbT